MKRKQGDAIQRLVSQMTVPKLIGSEDIVDELVTQKRALDRATKAFETARRILEPLATDVRTGLEMKGLFHNSVVLVGSHLSSSVTMTFGDRFKALDETEIASMKRLGTALYKRLFDEETSYSLNEEKVAKLRKVLRMAGEDPDEYMTTHRSVRPAADIRRVRAELRTFLDDEQNLALDTVIGHTQYQPSLSGIKWAEDPNEKT